MSHVPEFEFRTSRTCTYNNSDPRCVEVAANVPDKVAVRSFATGTTVEFTAVEWLDFLAGAKLGEFKLSAEERPWRSVPSAAAARSQILSMLA